MIYIGNAYTLLGIKLSIMLYIFRPAFLPRDHACTHGAEFKTHLGDWILDKLSTVPPSGLDCQEKCK